MRIEAQGKYLQKIIEEQQKLGSSLVGTESQPGGEDKQFQSYSHQATDASVQPLSPRKKQKVINEGPDGSAPSLAAPEIGNHWDPKWYNNDSQKQKVINEGPDGSAPSLAAPEIGNHWDPKWYNNDSQFRGPMD